MNGGEKKPTTVYPMEKFQRNVRACVYITNDVNSQRASTSLTYNVPFHNSALVNAAMPRSPKAQPPRSQQSPVRLNAELLWLETTHRHWFRPLSGTEQKEVLLLSIHSLDVCTTDHTSGQFAGGCRSSCVWAEPSKGSLVEWAAAYNTRRNIIFCTGDPFKE